ncbi:hypothetical protein ACFPRL_19450 [Pseudoclavibacter helvolus]
MYPCGAPRACTEGSPVIGRIRELNAPREARSARMSVAPATLTLCSRAAESPLRS